MQKDFQKWHTLKERIHISNDIILFREQELWWCSLGANIGTEEDGKNELFERPVLIFRKFNNEMFWGLPMTSQQKEGVFYFSFPLHGEDRTAILSQLRMLSAKRLIRRMSKMSDKQFKLLEDSLMRLIKETDPLRDPRVPNGNL